MLKYLDTLYQTLLTLKIGVEKHNAEWAGQPETPAGIQAKIDAIADIQREIKSLQDKLSQKKKQARLLQKETGLYANTIKNKAIGFHLANPALLKDYNIKLRKSYEKVPGPSESHAVIIKDTPSGKGFVVSTKSDPLADHYEWQKGIGDDPKTTDIIPPLSYYKTTSRSKFTDSDVETGVRYFYRVRATNRAGEGPWSPVVSRVQ